MDDLEQLRQAAAADPEKAAQLRAMAYERLSADPAHPKAPLLRTILSVLPKIKVGQGFDQPGLPKEIVHGELNGGGDFGLPPTPDEQVAQGQKERQTVRQLNRGPVEPPIGASAAAYLLNPAVHRQFIRGTGDTQNFGASQKIADKMHKALGQGEPLKETEQEDQFGTPDAPRSGHPGPRLLGQMLGLAIPGAGNLALKTGGAAGGLVANTGRGFLGKMLSGAVGGMVSNEVAMPLIAGGRQAVEGHNPLPVMADEANPIAHPSNAAAGALMGLPSGFARGIRDSGRTGRDIRLIEEYGATPSRIGRGPQGGVFESPFFHDVEGSASEQGMASRRAAENVLNTMDTEEAGVERQYAQAKKNAADQGWLEGRISTDAIRQDVEKLISRVRLTNPQKSAMKSEVLDVLDQHPNGMTLDDLNDLRAKVGDIFGTGPGESAHPALDTVRQSIKRTVDDTEMGPINENYHKGMTRIERQRQQLGLTEGSRRDVAERRIANLIQRRANDEAPGAGIQEAGDLGTEQFLKENQQHRPMFDTARLLAAKERLTAGFEPEAGFHRRMGHVLFEKNREPLMAAIYRNVAPAEQLAGPAALAARYLLTGGTQ